MGELVKKQNHDVTSSNCVHPRVPIGLPTSSHKRPVDRVVSCRFWSLVHPDSLSPLPVEASCMNFALAVPCRRLFQATSSTFHAPLVHEWLHAMQSFSANHPGQRMSLCHSGRGGMRWAPVEEYGKAMPSCQLHLI